ncbi:hypothetical protein HMPREF9123_2202 [Neisseria bacilliformis ATCC BAA-1200]|uniref:Uncharacterized protein n=1 Tax=Neisseria bacilliformis ATCC BAA-1200 TaxID=888742 RepID=F2BEP5_9NEIS|nr:hypothetical protein HMPREF9123_2202 [Neisseria bacilliformis ATCC BAA-1200]
MFSFCKRTGFVRAEAMFSDGLCLSAGGIGFFGCLRPSEKRIPRFSDGLFALAERQISAQRLLYAEQAVRQAAHYAAVVGKREIGEHNCRLPVCLAEGDVAVVLRVFAVFGFEQQQAVAVEGGRAAEQDVVSGENVCFGLGGADVARRRGAGVGVQRIQVCQCFLQGGGGQAQGFPAFARHGIADAQRQADEIVPAPAFDVA